MTDFCDSRDFQDSCRGSEDMATEISLLKEEVERLKELNRRLDYDAAASEGRRRAADLRILELEKRVAKAEAERDALKASIKHWQASDDCVGSFCKSRMLMNRVRSLTAERDALLADAERFRWLIETDPFNVCVISYRAPAACQHTDPRKAIDAARKA